MGLVIAYPYYNSGEELEQIIDHYNSFSDDTLSSLKFVICDDGSRSDRAITHIGRERFDLKIFEIEQDIFNNCPGANNVLMKEGSEEDVVIKMDIDFVLEEDDIKSLLNKIFEDKVYYNFCFKSNGLVLHVNIFACIRRVFWETGGYDEEFSGAKGFSDVLMRWLYSHNGIQVSSEKEYVLKRIDAPSCGTNEHGLDRNRELYEEKIKLLKDKKYVHPKNFNFEYDLVYIGESRWKVK